MIPIKETDNRHSIFRKYQLDCIYDENDAVTWLFHAKEIDGMIVDSYKLTDLINRSDEGSCTKDFKSDATAETISDYLLKNRIDTMEFFGQYCSKKVIVGIDFAGNDFRDTTAFIITIRRDPADIEQLEQELIAVSAAVQERAVSAGKSRRPLYTPTQQDVLQYIQTGILVHTARNKYQVLTRALPADADLSKMSLAELLKYEKTLRWDTLQIEKKDPFVAFGSIAGICKYLTGHQKLAEQCITEQKKYEAFLKHQTDVRKLLNLIS